MKISAQEEYGLRCLLQLARAESLAITILADKSIPFSVIKHIMSTCTSLGYELIALPDILKAGAVAGALAATGTGI
jgi:hypothetical protein